MLKAEFANNLKYENLLTWNSVFVSILNNQVEFICKPENQNDINLNS